MLQSSFIPSLTMGLKTKSEIFKLTSQQIAAFPTVLKMYNPHTPNVYTSWPIALITISTSVSSWIPNSPFDVEDRFGTGKQSLLIFNPTSWFSGSSTEVCLNRFVWMFCAHYQRWNTYSALCCYIDVPFKTCLALFCVCFTENGKTNKPSVASRSYLDTSLGFTS